MEDLILECESLSQDGKPRFIFDKLTSMQIDLFYSTDKSEEREVKLDSILDDKTFYISDETEFEIMPSRFSLYDTETKMTCRWSRYKLLTDFFTSLGFVNGLSNLGPEYEQSYVLSITDNDEYFSCILRIKPNLMIDLLSESSKSNNINKRNLSCFFSRDKILTFLSDVAPESYKSTLKSTIRNIKLKKVLE
jgi:hypothetical protein